MARLESLFRRVLIPISLFSLLLLFIVRIINPFHDLDEPRSTESRSPEVHKSFNILVQTTDSNSKEVENQTQIPSHEQFNSLVSLLSEPAVNFHDFRSIHNQSDFCSDSAPDVLFVIPSAPGNFLRRRNVRQGVIQKYVKESRNFTKLLFFTGNLPAENGGSQTTVFHKLQEEIDTFGDIVQEDFEDVYSNIRLKAVFMLKWVSYFCPKARLVIRTDDDVKVDPPRLVAAMMRAQTAHEHFILGHVIRGASPTRQKDYKSYMSVEEFPGNKLPDFVLGGLMGYPVQTVKLLYQLALRLKVIWLDDVYISGICAGAAGIPLVSDPDFKFQH